MITDPSEYYMYRAFFDPKESAPNVVFPDIPDCVSHANNFQQAGVYATRALFVYLYYAQKDPESIPPASSPQEALLKYVGKPENRVYDFWFLDIAINKEELSSVKQEVVDGMEMSLLSTGFMYVKNY